jgi:hypothetical protein
MEIISWEMAIYTVVAVVSSLLGLYAVRRLDRWLKHRNAVEARLRDLAEHPTRQELTGFLQKQQVVGDADIRNGFVLAPVPPEKLDPLAVVLGNAAAMIARLRNPAASSLYVRDSVNDRFMLLGDLDLDHLVDAARVMQHVAEDRRKSRSLYKGLTDDEMRAMVRAGLSQWLKDDGSFPESNEVMQGLWDERPEFLMAMNVLDLLFKVKGASNG